MSGQLYIPELNPLGVHWLFILNRHPKPITSTPHAREKVNPPPTLKTPHPMDLYIETGLNLVNRNRWDICRTTHWQSNLLGTSIKSNL